MLVKEAPVAKHATNCEPCANLFGCILQNTTAFFKENEFENVVWQLSNIVCEPQYDSVDFFTRDATMSSGVIILFYSVASIGFFYVVYGPEHLNFSGLQVSYQYHDLRNAFQNTGTLSGESTRNALILLTKSWKCATSVFSLLLDWQNCLTNSRVVGDLRRLDALIMNLTFLWPSWATLLPNLEMKRCIADACVITETLLVLLIVT